jgi:transposase
MTPKCAWSVRGTRAVDVVPFTKTSNVSVLTAMRVDGVCAWNAYDGAVNGERFLQFVEEKLVKTLRPGNVVVLDNVRFHHMAPVRELVERQGAKLVFIPAYHPELNAAEELFSFLKSSLRRRKERALAGLVTAIGEIFGGVGFHRLRAFIMHAMQLSAQPL